MIEEELTAPLLSFIYSYIDLKGDLYMKTHQHAFMWVKVLPNGLCEASGIVTAEDYNCAAWKLCEHYGYDMNATDVWLLDIQRDIDEGSTISCDEFRRSQIIYWRKNYDFRREKVSTCN